LNNWNNCGDPDQEVAVAYKIALIPGDGIGKEVVPEGVRK
jgi:hypothetical protein